MNSDLEMKYGNILESIVEDDKSTVDKSLTLGLILGDELIEFYDRYFSDINLIVEEILLNKFGTKNVNTKQYIEICYGLLYSMLLDEDDRNSAIIKNYLNAMSILRNNDDIEDNLIATVLTTYEYNYLKS